MSQEQRDTLDQMMRNGPLAVGGDPQEQRSVFERMMTARPLPDDVVTTPGELGGIATVAVEVDGIESADVILWFHGGFYVVGSATMSAALASSVARRARARVISVDYRLAPEHPYPAALEDALASYRALLDSGVPASRIAFAGESAGAGLVIATLVALKSAGLPQPFAAVAFSPYVDLTLSGASITEKAAVDPCFTPEGVRRWASLYIADGNAQDSLISPLFADLTGLPPLLIQVGSHEILLDDAARLATRAAAADVAVTLDVTPGVPHVFQAFAAVLEEGDAALTRVASFLNAHRSQDD
jgi:epsilon-lactone hydrolase